MIVGRINKDNADVSRATIDFSQWLDVGEAVSALASPVVVVEQNASWQQGAYIATPPPPVVDSTPLTVLSTTSVNSNLQLQIMLQAGTPGLTYKVTFIGVGSVSGRNKQIDLIVNIREPA